MLRKIKHTMTAWWRTNVVGDDPNPEYSPNETNGILGRFDRGTIELAGAVDTDLLAAALSDGDNPVLRDEVTVTESGALIHRGDLGGAR